MQIVAPICICKDPNLLHETAVLIKFTVSFSYSPLYKSLYLALMIIFPQSKYLGACSCRREFCLCPPWYCSGHLCLWVISVIPSPLPASCRDLCAGGHAQGWQPLSHGVKPSQRRLVNLQGVRRGTAYHEQCLWRIRQNNSILVITQQPFWDTALSLLLFVTQVIDLHSDIIIPERCSMWVGFSSGFPVLLVRRSAKRHSESFSHMAPKNFRQIL